LSYKPRDLQKEEEEGDGPMNVTIRSKFFLLQHKTTWALDEIAAYSVLTPS
jgi:hypothetical protein